MTHDLAMLDERRTVHSILSVFKRLGDALMIFRSAAKLALPVFGALFAACMACATVSAARLVVTTGSDGPIGGTAGCSLREAVQAINAQANGNGCNNLSSQPYGTNDRIEFATNVRNIALSLPSNQLSATALIIGRPVTIRGHGSTVTIIDGGGASLTLIENGSRLTLRSLQLRNAATALRNAASASAVLIQVNVTRQSKRAVINLGQMSLLVVNVTGNPGGGIANLNATPISQLGGAAVTALLSDICDPECLDPNDTAPGQSSFPAGEAPAAMTVVLSVIADNGPVPCAGIVNGGGIVQDQGGIGGIGGNPLVQHKLEGAITLRRTRVVRNDAGGTDGGGICNHSVALISQSEISANRARNGGGIAVLGLPPATPVFSKSFTVLANSTISSNTAAAAGAGIFVAVGTAELRVQFSTIALNVAGGSGAGDAGGLAARIPITATFRFSALTGNQSQATASAVKDCANIALNGDFNFWTSADTGSCNFAGTHNVRSGAALLSPLAANGALAHSHIPAAASALVDAIPVTQAGCSGFDQRQTARPRDGNQDGMSACDIGAVERP